MDWTDSVLTEDFKNIAESNLPLEEFRNARFLITGATGLIGSLLVRFLLFANREYNLNIQIKAVVRNVEKAKQIFIG